MKWVFAGGLILGIVLIALFISFVYVVFWQNPNDEVELAWRTDATLTTKDFYELKNQIRQTMSQIIGGMVLLIGLFLTFVSLFFTWRTVRGAEKNLVTTQEATRRTLEISQEGQITDRFSRAVEHLGSQKLQIRLGGIYALERIARDSKDKDYWPTIRILTAYVRDRSPWIKDQPFSPPATDIQAILTVLGGLGNLDPPHDEDIRYLDLSGTDLRGADFSRTTLIRAHFGNAHLEGAQFWEAHLENADFWEGHLLGAHFGKACLEHADFRMANLDQVTLNQANLKNADLRGAHLEGADFEHADLAGAHLERVDLRDARNLTAIQVGAASTGQGTLYPEYLHPSR